MLKKIFFISCFIVTLIANAQIMLPAYQPMQYVDDDTLCTQNWSTINLDTSTYSDGTPIPEITDPNQWSSLTTGAWCYYNNDPANGPIYGKLYNWYAAAGIYDAASLANPSLRKNLAPLGWHVPTETEWRTLITCLGGAVGQGAPAGGKMKESGMAHWTSPNTGATNSSGFTGLPGGYSDGFGGLGGGLEGNWWSSSESNIQPYSWRCKIKNTDTTASMGQINKLYGLSVRCVKD